jgi:GLPGLI family protein
MNVKLFLILNVIFLSGLSSIAQMVVMPREIDNYIVVDSSRIVVKYTLDFIRDPEKPLSIDKDIVVLEIGSVASKSYSNKLFTHDSVATKNKRSQGVPMLQVAVPPVEVFKNYPAGKNTIIHRSPLSGPVFLYEDEFIMKWEILPECTQLMGYPCQKATMEFRGRKWEAWFTQQIPVSDGPWKFHGLPGLILQVSDDQNHYTFTCISLIRKAELIKKWNWQYEYTSREKIHTLLKRYAERPYVVGQQIGIRFADDSLKDKSVPYNPIELE